MLLNTQAHKLVRDHFYLSSGYFKMDFLKCVFYFSGDWRVDPFSLSSCLEQSFTLIHFGSMGIIDCLCSIYYAVQSDAPIFLFVLF